MIKQRLYTVSDPGGLAEILASHELQSASSKACSVLVQIFTAITDPKVIRKLATTIAEAMPEAVIVGATTVGEIFHGRLLTQQTIIGFTFFETSRVTATVFDCTTMEERQAGRLLQQQIEQQSRPVVGVMLLATTASIDATQFLHSLKADHANYTLFGGGAADYATMMSSLVLCGNRTYSRGLVAVTFTGPTLHIDARTYLGWRPLSKNMTITGVVGQAVSTIDDAPAHRIYKRYLNIRGDKDFFLDALAFPILLKRDEEIIARVPVSATPEHGLQFIADVTEGETIRIGYGDPDLITSNATQVHQTTREFSPQAIFLYSCSCRRFFMQQDVEIETLPFEKIAPTFGFYTYGEFFANGNGSPLLNATMVAVSIREGEAPSPEATHDHVVPRHEEFKTRSTQIISHLAHFINTTISELEVANQKIRRLSRTDPLTQIANRLVLDEVLSSQIKRDQRHGETLSIVLLDIDHFKQVNDTHGHLAGDGILKAIARTLSHNLRSIDTLGRWGGEEFLIVCPHTKLEGAVQLAEKMRTTIANTPFPPAGRITCSFGVTRLLKHDTIATLTARADQAMYEAKRNGRNKVETAE